MLIIAGRRAPSPLERPASARVPRRWHFRQAQGAVGARAIQHPTAAAAPHCITLHHTFNTALLRRLPRLRPRAASVRGLRAPYRKLCVLLLFHRRFGRAAIAFLAELKACPACRHPCRVHRTITLAKRPLVAGFANHWGVRVGDTWYEVKGMGSRDNKNPNKVIITEGTHADVEDHWFTWTEIVGTTYKTNAQMRQWKNAWLRENPSYEVMTCNCQSFVLGFVHFLSDGSAKMPRMEAGEYSAASGPSAWAGCADQMYSTRVTMPILIVQPMLSLMGATDL